MEAHHNGFMNELERHPIPSAAFFAPLVGSCFTVDTLSGPIALRLDACTELPRGGRPAALPTPLSLIFSGPAQPQLVQDNYYFDHPSMPRQTWCIAPVAPALPHDGEPARQRYQIMFA